MDALQIPIEMVLERPQSKEVVRALLHTILFHRLFGTVKPYPIELLDTTFPGVSDPDTEQNINTKVDEFCNGVDSLPGGNGVVKSGKIIITFFEKRKERRWFTEREEVVAWERWILTIHLLPKQPPPPSQHFRPVFPPPPSASLPSPTPLNPIIMLILSHVSSVKGRDAVPPILNKEGLSPFPLKIDVSIERGGVA